MTTAHRLLLAALASLAAGEAGLAQPGPGAAAPGSAGGWKSHGPFLVCHDPNGSSGCVVETGVLVRAGNRVEVRARGKVNFGGESPPERPPRQPAPSWECRLLLPSAGLATR